MTTIEKLPQPRPSGAMEEAMGDRPMLELPVREMRDEPELKAELKAEPVVVAGSHLDKFLGDYCVACGQQGHRSSACKWGKA